MARRKGEAMTRRHIWLPDEDYARIEQLFGKTIGPSDAIRRMIRAWLRAAEARIEGSAQPVPVDPGELEKVL